MRPLGALTGDDGLEGLQPFPGLLGIDIGRGLRVRLGHGSFPAKESRSLSGPPPQTKVAHAQAHATVAAPVMATGGRGHAPGAGRYLPMQKVEKICPSKSSTSTRPVISPSA